MNEFFAPFTRSTSSKATIKNKICKFVLHFLLRVGLALEDTTNPNKGKARKTGNLVNDILRPVTIEHLPTIMYFEQVTPCYRPCHLALPSNNNFVFMEMYT